MTLVLHLSDTHFGTEIPEVAAALAESCRALAPDVVVASGDLTQRAREKQFIDARTFLDGLGIAATLAVPGNHDIPLYDLPSRFARPYRLYERFFGARERLWRGDGLAIVCLDATSPRRHTRGLTRLAAARRLLEAARREAGDAARLLVAEHQPLAVKMPQDEDEVLINARETAALFCAFGVDAVLSGHVHMPLVRTTAGLFDLPRPFVLSGAGTAVSHRTRPGGPNCFNTILVETQRMAVTLHAYRDGQFMPEAQWEFALGAPGWTPAGA